LHRGRVQSQGGGIEDSEKWNFKNPISSDTAKVKTDILKNRHTRRSGNERAEAFEKAKKFIDILYHPN